MLLENVKDLPDGGAVFTFTLDKDEVISAISYAVFNWIKTAVEAENIRNEVKDED